MLTKQIILPHNISETISNFICYIEFSPPSANLYLKPIFSNHHSNQHFKPTFQPRISNQHFKPHQAPNALLLVGPRHANTAFCAVPHHADPHQTPDPQWDPRCLPWVLDQRQLRPHIEEIWLAVSTSAPQQAVQASEDSVDHRPAATLSAVPISCSRLHAAVGLAVRRFRQRRPSAAVRSSTLQFWYHRPAAIPSAVHLSLLRPHAALGSALSRPSAAVR